MNAMFGETPLGPRAEKKTRVAKFPFIDTVDRRYHRALHGAMMLSSPPLPPSSSSSHRASQLPHAPRKQPHTVHLAHNARPSSTTPPWAKHADCSRGEDARKRLEDGLHTPCLWKSCVFDDVVPAIGFPSCSWILKGDSQGAKSIINPQHSLRLLNRSCIVYGAGIARDSTFEKRMATHCEVHAFDCTVGSTSPAVFRKRFAFHQTCIGNASHGTDAGSTTASELRKSDFFKNNTHRSHDAKLTFRPLSALLERLGHKHLDLLKIDIEGGEWEVLRTELLRPEGVRPHQIAFELHTQWAPSRFVPPNLVTGKGKEAVNRLFLDLFDIGYSVVSKDVSASESSCAEFVVALGCPPSNGGGDVQSTSSFHPVSCFHKETSRTSSLNIAWAMQHPWTYQGLLTIVALLFLPLMTLVIMGVAAARDPDAVHATGARGREKRVA